MFHDARVDWNTCIEFAHVTPTQRINVFASVEV